MLDAGRPYIICVIWASVQLIALIASKITIANALDFHAFGSKSIDHVDDLLRFIQQFILNVRSASEKGKEANHP